MKENLQSSNTKVLSFNLSSSLPCRNLGDEAQLLGPGDLVNREEWEAEFTLCTDHRPLETMYTRRRSTTCNS
jgi:hypothetical protein